MSGKKIISPGDVLEVTTKPFSLLLLPHPSLASENNDNSRPISEVHSQPISEVPRPPWCLPPSPLRHVINVSDHDTSDEIPIMADPFEVRMRFSNMLNTLNASLTSAHKTAVYALKHREMDEDLQSCIVEQLEKKHNMNNKANIMYFYEALCDLASKENHLEYVRMMERDIMRIVDLVAPKDGTGAANVKVVRKVLRNLAGKHYLQLQTVEELEDYMTDRDQINGQAGFASPDQTGHYSNNNVRNEKRQIGERIEEDRERHKRLREVIWITHDDEFEQMWNEVPETNPDDFIAAKEQSDERKHYAELHRIEYSAKQ